MSQIHLSNHVFQFWSWEAECRLHHLLTLIPVTFPQVRCSRWDGARRVASGLGGLGGGDGAVICWERVA